MDYLYHITDLANLDSILAIGLLPSIGRHRLRCSIDIERESDDPRISLCDEEHIAQWQTALYKKTPDTKSIVLKIDVHDLELKKRQWASGYEYACWDTIPPDRITIQQ